jgi:hypothetical protein
MRDAIDVVPDMCGQRRSPSVDELIAGLADRQHGVVARRQLVALGLSLDAIDHRVARGRLHVLHRGVYAVGHRALRREAYWMAAVLAGGDGAVLFRRSAALLWGIRSSARAAVEIAVPRERRNRPGIEAYETRTAPDELTSHDGIPVTTPRPPPP